MRGTAPMLVLLVASACGGDDTAPAGGMAGAPVQHPAGAGSTGAANAGGGSGAAGIDGRAGSSGAGSMDAGRSDSAMDSGLDTGTPSADAGGPDTGVDSGSDGGAPAGDPTFSFLVVPDTQNEVLDDEDAARYFDHRIAWIVEHREMLDVRWVLQTGDLVNWDTPDHDQYVRASAGFEALDAAGIPYVIAIGNHDTAATCEGGSACPGNTNQLLRDTSTFNEYFPTTRFPTLTGVFEAGKSDNSYHLLEAGGLDWVIISIELWARTEAYQWMDQVLEDHPGHNAIVITHSHLDGAGEIFASNGGYGDNSPLEIFDEVLSRHANVRFVFSGHTGVSAYREDEGVPGNTIHQFLYNRLDGVNPVRVVEVDVEARTVDTYVYSPATDDTLETPGCTVHLTGIDWVR